jgi:hypothetical protein
LRLALGHTAARYWFIHPKLASVDHLRWTGWGASTVHARGLKYARKPGGGFYRHEVSVELGPLVLVTARRVPA